jgi:hypothetical protein
LDLYLSCEGLRVRGRVEDTRVHLKLSVVHVKGNLVCILVHAGFVRRLQLISLATIQCEHMVSTLNSLPSNLKLLFVEFHVFCVVHLCICFALCFVNSMCFALCFVNSMCFSLCFANSMCFTFLQVCSDSIFFSHHSDQDLQAQMQQLC